MEKVFIDSDILLDLLAKREPFYDPAARLFCLIEKEKIKAYTSPNIFINIHYILRKSIGKEQALKSIQKLKLLMVILPVDEKIVNLALYSEFKDFEDAIQFFAAKEHGIKCILTRNKRDYLGNGLTILTAEEYLSTHPR